MRIFLDANVLFAASWSDGAVRRLLRELLADGHTLVADDYVLAEARRNLVGKSRDGAQELDRIVRRIEVVPFVPHPTTRATAILPEKDRPVLAAAIHTACDVLVTGDRRHFGVLYGRVIGGVAIHSPASLAETLFS
jgi:predicted nucleic acid-binding protein